MTAGTLVGGFIAMWYKARRPIAFGMAACMLTALPMLALAARLPLYLVVVSSVVGMLGVLVLNTNWGTAIQQVIPNEMLSRFRRYDYLIAFVAMPVGYAVAGPLESSFGADKVLYAAGALAVAAKRDTRHAANGPGRCPASGRHHHRAIEEAAPGPDTGLTNPGATGCRSSWIGAEPGNERAGQQSALSLHHKVGWMPCARTPGLSVQPGGLIEASLWKSVAWLAGIFNVLMPLAVRPYKRAS